MEFFNKVRVKLKVRNLIWTFAFAVLTCLFGYRAILRGFPSGQTGVNQSNRGIPVPNWLRMGVFLLMCGIFFVSAFFFLKSAIQDTEYKKMLQAVASMGDVAAIGATLAAMAKSNYPKSGDLRFDERIIFYLDGTNVTVIPPASIREIKTGKKAGEYHEKNYVCVYYGNDILKIKTSIQNTLPLLEEMRKTFAANLQEASV